ncbi:eukaryotic translation initiation factor 3 subunit K [Galendromus occidentalis]|uniref:Eukaryotic translation initiation factor 3 subunit K n=1 Tax=Galendromus occidentalis TaxID=34638 RepID=A0AAJ6VV11_9ACAR|nr:eukaryotic translation initiation factor 3 subunit K [Galendromus occidentalis]
MSLFGTVQAPPSEQVQKARVRVAEMLQELDRYNPQSIPFLENYVDLQCKANFYDQEANLAVLKLYQFNPGSVRTEVIAQILLKALTNLPHTDFVLCKCLIDLSHFGDRTLETIMQLHSDLEQCEFQKVWTSLSSDLREVEGVLGFEDSIRNYIGIVVNKTYQRIDKRMLCEFLNVKEKDLKPWMDRFSWKAQGVNDIFIANHEESIKTKSILEKITFESVEQIMANSQAK